MKSSHVSPEELSAHADGMARHPQRIVNHLAVCTACSRRYAELRAMREALRELPAPEAQPYFMSKVRARLEEQEPAAEPLLARFMYVVPGIIVALVLAVVYFLVMPPSPERAAIGVDAPEIAYDVRWQRDEEVVAALVSLMEEGGDIGLFEEGMVAEETRYEEEAAETVIESLAWSTVQTEVPGWWTDDGLVSLDEIGRGLEDDPGQWPTHDVEEN